MAGVGKTTVPEDPNKTTTGKAGCEMSICKAFLMDDPRAAYFRQVQYGLYVRMALILTLLDMTDAHMNHDLLRKF